ncbi:protein NO VEIN domain-containing protein [Clostridium sp. WILCCON 0269]|uniref:Protein NO VEIN domain-containing protein n=1 Tax=Candidatus Clostridium eludens TaxID=3381663 RepID=A0ABW8SJ28_9CLOT
MTKHIYQYTYDIDKKKLYENKLYIEGKKDICRYALLFLDKLESEDNTPFYNLSKNQLEDNFKKLNSSSVISPVFTRLNDYAEWYSKEYLNASLESRYFSKLLNKNEIIKHVKLYSDIKKLCKDSFQFYDLLNNTNCNPLEKAIAVLLYIGLNQEDIINLRIDWLDLENGTIRLPNRIFQNISKSFISFINQSLIFDEQQIKKGKLNPLDKIYFLKRKRKLNSNPRNTGLITPYITKFRKCNENKAIQYCKNATDISLSGFYNYLMSLEYDDAKCIEPKNIVYKKDIFEGKYTEDKLKNSISTKATNIKNQYIAFKKYNNITNNSVFDAAKITMYPKGNIVERNNHSIENKLSKQKIERTELGEKKVKEALVKKYGEDNVYKVKNSEGFDFQVTYNSQAIMDIEVKTICNLQDTFCMTINEIEKNRNKENYYLFLVVLKEGAKEEECIKIIKNPFDKLGINVEELIGGDNNYFKYNNCIIKAQSFSIKISLIDKIRFEEIL